MIWMHKQNIQKVIDKIFHYQFVCRFVGERNAIENWVWYWFAGPRLIWYLVRFATYLGLVWKIGYFVWYPCCSSFSITNRPTGTDWCFSSRVQEVFHINNESNWPGMDLWGTPHKKSDEVSVFWNKNYNCSRWSALFRANHSYCEHLVSTEAIHGHLKIKLLYKLRMVSKSNNGAVFGPESKLSNIPQAILIRKNLWTVENNEFKDLVQNILTIVWLIIIRERLSPNSLIDDTLTFSR